MYEISDREKVAQIYGMAVISAVMGFLSALVWILIDEISGAMLFGASLAIEITCLYLMMWHISVAMDELVRI